MHRKLPHILVLIILVASTLVGCGGSGTPCSTLAKVSVTDGDVLVMKAGTDDWTEAQAEMELEVGDSMKTVGNSTAEITFFDGSVLGLEAGTEIEILSLDNVCSIGVTTITLLQTIGTTISRITQVLDPASLYEVETPSGAAGVRGSIMIVRVLEDGTTFVTNEEGTVYARAQGEEVEVPVDQTYVMYPGQPPLISGSLVQGFGTGGVVTSNSTAGYDWANAIAIDSTSMYVVGCDNFTAGDSQWRMGKRSLASGDLDTGFGIDGVVISNPSSYTEEAYAIAIDSTYMYVVGRDGTSGDGRWRIEKRSLTDGSLDTGFGTGGVVTSNPSLIGDDPHAIAIDSAYMYVVGYDYGPGDLQWRIEKRSLTDGSLDTGFGTGGVVSSNPSLGVDHAYAIAIDSTAMYVVGQDASPGNAQWRIEKRSLTDGSLDTGFDTDGVVTSNPSSNWDTAYAIVIDSTAMYIVGQDANPGDAQWRIEKRSLTDGSLDTGFGTDGVVTSNPGSNDDAAYAIAIDSAAMYVVGWDESPGSGNWQWRIEKRSLTDGSLDTGFDTDGVITGNPSTGDDEPLGIAIDSTAMYVVGWDESPGTGDWQWRIEKRVK